MTDTKKTDQTASPKKTHVDHTSEESLIKAANAFSKQPRPLTHLLAGESLNRLNAVQACQEPEAGSMNVVALIQSKGEPRVDSRVLAEQLGNKHKNTMALIERYTLKIKQFGLLPFQTEARPAGQHGGGDARFALLNEDQAFFLLALSRNTDRVVELKSSLILAFREARYGHACQTLETRKKEASRSGSRLARWRYDKPSMHQHVAHLKEQLKLPLELEVRL
ncbi:Rha family transcriptional regulator [Pseudomonas helleri]|uniref:Rha family transcriptional regulator n=2 Tax=Pseudomonas helleri TaxID=1608996 RepID=UPI003FD3AF37